MLFHYGRTFEINDLVVDPAYQRRGIAKLLLERCLADIKEQGIAGMHLITAGLNTSYFSILPNRAALSDSLTV